MIDKVNQDIFQFEGGWCKAQGEKWGLLVEHTS